MSLLQIKNLKVSIEGKKILKGVSLTVPPGKIHALMGPNGSGKSTLASVVMGHPSYQIDGGTIFFGGKNIKKLPAEDRAKLGLFLSFQYPAEIAGLSIEHFLRTAYNNIYPRAKLRPLEFHKLCMEKVNELKVRKDLAGRYLNAGFSGGEKKKLEILQLAVLRPRLALLDETDSGLDIDALKSVAQGVKKVKDKKMGVLIITHYFRILKHIVPDQVHIMIDGKIVKTGSRKLASEVERRGYDWLKNKADKS